MTELLEEAIENQQAFSFSLSSSLLQSLLNDDFYRNQKNQPLLNELKADVFTTMAAIVKYSQKQNEAVNKLKQKFLTTLYPISDNVMKLPNADVKPLSSRVIENGVKKQKMEEEKQRKHKERRMFSPFLISLKRNETKTAYEIVEPSNPTKKASKVCMKLFHFFLILHSKKCFPLWKLNRSKCLRNFYQILNQTNISRMQNLFSTTCRGFFFLYSHPI